MTPRWSKNCYSVVCREELPQSGKFTSQPLLSPHHHGSEYRSLSFPFPIVICHQTCLCCAPMAPAPILPNRVHRLLTEPLSVPLPGSHPSDSAIPAGLPEPHGGRGEDGCGEGGSTGRGQGEQAAVGLPDLGCLSGLSPGSAGWGEERGKGGESRMKDKEVA